MRLSRLRSVRLLLAIGVLGAVGAAINGVVVGQSSKHGGELQKRIDLLVQSLTIVRDRHVLKPEVPGLVENAVRGMLEKVDPDAHFFTATEYAWMRSQVQRGADQAGIGLTVRKDPGQRRGTAAGFRIVAAATGGAGARAGLRTGDLITHVNEQPVGGWPTSEVEARFVGPVGTRVTLSVQRRGSDVGFDVVLLRDPITTIPVITRLAGNVVHLAVSTIGPGIESEIQAALSNVGIDASAIAGLVLDLRNCPGGSIKTAVLLADLFLDSGVIAFERSRRGPTSIPVSVARPGSLLEGKPISVLVNGGSAMAAEIVAAALRDNKRAWLVGTQTAGRAGEMQLLELGKDGKNAGALLLTTRRYVAPSGQEINGKGLAPDIVIEQVGLDPVCRDTDTLGADGKCTLRSHETDVQLVWAHALVKGAAEVVGLP